jgi:outer membrane protein assembly factor BamB
MTTAPKSASVAAEPAPVAPRKSRLFPGWIVLSTVALCLLVMVVVRTIQPLEGTPAPWNDEAIASIFTAIFSFIAAMTLLGWFVIRSTYPGVVRMVTVAAAIAAVGVFIACFRFEGVNGAMQPTFVPRWRKIAEQEVGELAAQPSAAEIDLASVSDSDFPQFLGPHRSGYLPGPELDRNWKANPPKELWRRPIGAGWSGFASAGGYAVTLEQRGDDEWVTCYALDTGAPAWGSAIKARHYNPLGGLGPRSTPTIHNGKVYALGATGVLRCLSGKDGTEIWSDDLRKRYFGDKAPDELGKLDEGLVQWGESARSLAAFQAESGELVWEGGDDQISYASPASATLAGGLQILSVNEKTVTGHDPATGAVLWKHDWPGNSMQDANNSQPVVLPGNRVLLTKGYGGGAELIEVAAAEVGGPLTAKTVWRNKGVLETKFTNVCVIGEHVYGLSNGYLECVELASGTKTWKKSRQANFAHGQILGVGDVILVQGEEGEVALVEANPERFVELGRLGALSAKTWNNLCLVGKKLLVRNDREAACYELP